MMTTKSLYKSRLIDLIPEMAHRFCPILSRRKNATSSRRPLSLRLSVRKRTTLCTHRFSHQSLSQSSGQQFQKRSSFQRHRRHQCLRWLPRKFPSPSSPALLNRGIAPWPRRTALRKVARNTMFGSFGAIHAAATLRELDPRGAERRWGYSDVYWGGRGRGQRGRRRRGMLVDQEIGADAMTAFVRLECPLPRHFPVI
ncbi:hypothetical protein EDB85DRAFT_345827 [Lactarius pseudohatsudake]|nr:hypothetical protein EDB85DRAFT_345827 [Lactarius pseudohatsudake]